MRIPECYHRIPTKFEIDPLTFAVKIYEKKGKLTNCDIGCSFPRAVLGRFFKNTVWWSGIFEFVFCSMDDTVRAVQRKAIDTTKILTSHCNAYCKMKLKKVLSEDSFIFRALIWRLYYAHEVYNDPKKYGLEQIPRLTVQLFIDTHIDMMRAIEETRFMDKGLTELMVNPYSNVVYMYDQFYPSDARFFYCGDLPDVTHLIDMGSLWFNVNSKSSMECIARAIIHIICSKTQYFRCQGRNNMNILYEYFKKYPDILSLYRHFIRVGLLGNYPGDVVTRPPFKERMKIYDFFQAVSDDNFIRWITKNEKVVRVFTKEFYTYCIDVQYALDKFMSKSKLWTNMKDFNRKSANRVREIVFNPSGFNVEELNIMIASIRSDSSDFIRKLKKNRFDISVTKMFQNFYNQNVVNRSNTELQECTKYIPNEYLVAMSIIAETDAPFQTKWIKCFGVSREGYHSFREMYFRYTFGGISDNSVKKAIREIYERNPQDFFTINVFMTKIDWERDTSEYYLPADFERNQIASLRAKYQCFYNQELPKGAGVFYFCSNCKKWAHPIVTWGQKGINNSFSTGTYKSMYNFEQKAAVCGRQTLPVNIRKMKENGKYDEEFSKEEKDARLIRRFKKNQQCSQTPLIPVNMIGIVKTLDKKLWILCEVCACIMQFDGTKFTHQGVTCGNHKKMEKTRMYRTLQVHPMILEKKCFYCEVSEKVKSLKLVKMTDREGGRYGLEKYYVCDVEFERIKHYQEKNGHYMNLSHVINFIRNSKQKALEFSQRSHIPNKF